ncbi:MAG: hypothetical protein K2I67_02720, partial [Malacoplasma sp.]|nr:hypothetical protein [Malacoplasma sp.]
MDYDLEFMVNVLNYNQQRKYAFNHGLQFEENKDYERVLNARRAKVSRLKRRFLYLFSRFDYIWFVTFTFSNDYIDKSDKTKRRLMKSVLNTHDFKYILNVDYGKQTEREHYHCILATNWDMDVNQYIQ